MKLIPAQPWTISFIREWWPYMSLRSVLRLRDYELRSARGEQIPGHKLELRMKAPVRGSVSLWEVGSDVLTFTEVIKEQVYESVRNRLRSCETVIDLGANIGLTTLYFAGHYPGSRFLAVEPNSDTFQLLTANLKELIDDGRCQTLKAAVWGSSRALVRDPSQAPEHYSAFAMKEASADENSETISGWPIQKIIDDSRFTQVDLLKVDIEGAEVELFKGDLDWLRRVGAIAIEFHNGSREQSRFDEIMRAYRFSIYDHDPHTVLALKEEENR